MRLLSCIAVGLTVSAAFPAAALAGRAAVAATPHVIAAPRMVGAPIRSRPTYGPPLRPVYGPPQGYSGVQGAQILDRHGGRFVNYRGYGYGYGFAPTLPSWGYYGAPAVAPQPVSEVYTPEPTRPRPVIYNLPPQPLSQGDIGYVAQPAIYNVGQALRKYPPTK